ncbi:uncharacterized protein LOC142177595 [Nicotiana tabacum]|uniref:Uncharacterized protein LOC142177595 n=1 Tax=Nicotiana tabacum TaxID=4097 RepID=A0AC58U088_TOBAC
MADNTINGTRNPEIQGEQPHFEDTISDTRNEENDATPTHVDPGSSANIIQWRVLEQAKLSGSIIPATKLLAGFNLASVTTWGEILLLTNAEGVMKTTLFEVVDGDMGYNIILGRQWLHEMKAVPSTYHQLLTFPTPEGIKQIKGDQLAAREMNAVLISSSKGKERAS